MRKFALCCSLVFLISSCSEEIVFNNPSVQGLKDNVFWRALQSKAVLSKEGTIEIEAVTLKETLKLHFSSTQVKEIVLDNAADDFATFTSKETTPITFLSTKDGEGSGKMSITEYDELNKTISGTFKFVIRIPVAVGEKTKELYFSQGVFYKVPVTQEVATFIK